MHAQLPSGDMGPIWGLEPSSDGLLPNFLCMSSVKAQTSMRGCAASPEPSLHTDVLIEGLDGGGGGLVFTIH